MVKRMMRESKRKFSFMKSVTNNANRVWPTWATRVTNVGHQDRYQESKQSSCCSSMELVERSSQLIRIHHESRGKGSILKGWGDKRWRGTYVIRALNAKKVHNAIHREKIQRKLMVKNRLKPKIIIHPKTRERKHDNWAWFMIHILCTS